MTNLKYEAPKLTQYGKLSEFIEVGSTLLAVGDVTGDGIDDELYDTDGDNIGDVVVGGDTGNQTPVTKVGMGTYGYLFDADGDGDGGITINFLLGGGSPYTLQRVPPGSPDIGFNPAESAADDGWDNPARD